MKRLKNIERLRENYEAAIAIIDCMRAGNKSLTEKQFRYVFHKARGWNVNINFARYQNYITTKDALLKDGIITVNHINGFTFYVLTQYGNRAKFENIC